VTSIDADMDRIVPFRAGGPRSPGIAARLLPAGPHVYLADCSEFQPDIHDGPYLKWSKAIAVRAAYGAHHDDRAWYGGQRRDLLHAGGVRFCGIYQYLVGTQDPVQQAKALVRLLGSMRPGEKIIADIEEGRGDQQARWAAWSHVIADGLGDAPWRYSGLDFAATHGLQPVQWVAAYRATEPPGTHKLWQFTDSYPVPGVGLADCSIWHGTIDQLAEQAWQPAKPTPPSKPAPPPVTAPAPHPQPQWPAGEVLREGNRGDAVTVLQEALNATHLRGVRNITVDGTFGAQTLASVEHFQAAKGLQVDGIAGPVTRSALGV
jgi:putative peptidoglycan binding protein/glycosyl hydrolase family 25